MFILPVGLCGWKRTNVHPLLTIRFKNCINLLLAECEVRRASYGPNFFLLLWPKREARGPWKQGRKKRGSITCPTDWANEANMMFIIWLCRLFRFWNGDRELEVRTATYGLGIDQSQHAKSVSHIINTFDTTETRKYFLLNWRVRHISIQF